MLERLENDPEIQAIWAQVNIIAPTDADAMEIFYKYFRDFGFEHSHCDNPNVCRAEGDRMSVCKGCGQGFWFTSGTLLARVKRFKPYLAAFLIREAGLIISAAAFARLADIHVATASNIQRKISMAILNCMEATDADAAAVAGRLFKDIIARRSRETPARMHPFAEEEEIESAQLDLNMDAAASEVSPDALPVSMESSEAVDDGDVDPFEQAIRVVYGLLSEIKICAEKLSLQANISIGRVNGALTMLELRGQAKQLPDGKFVRVITVPKVVLSDAESTYAARVGFSIGVAQNIIGKVFHRVSRKALQLYLAAVWGVLDREKWGLCSIFQLCFEHPPITYSQLLHYVSPPILKLVLR